VVVVVSDENDCSTMAGSLHYGTTQIGAAATPGIRQLELAHILGGRAVAVSICPATLDTTSPDYGYRPAFPTLADLGAARLGR
jgi:hypothetical protein